MVCHVSSTKILGYLAQGNREELHEYIKHVFDELRLGGSYSCVHHTFIDCLSIAKSGLEKMDFDQVSNIRNRLDYGNWNHLSSVAETESYLWDLFESILIGRYAPDAVYSASVRKAIAYMEEFYASSITLEEIAGHVEISKSYLSMLFKQETGINLVAFLNQYRIGRGKKLLATTNLKIYEIADVIGFGSPYYFSKVFKTMTGMQCKEYRDTFLEVNRS
jgi:two-component system response regulator YesN